MFLHLSVILFTGGSAIHPLGDTPWADIPQADTPMGRHPLVRHPPGQTPPWADTPPRSACWDTVNMRAVRILLECNLVVNINTPLFLAHLTESKQVTTTK